MRFGRYSPQKETLWILAVYVFDKCSAWAFTLLQIVMYMLSFLITWRTYQRFLPFPLCKQCFSMKASVYFSSGYFQDGFVDVSCPRDHVGGQIFYNCKAFICFFLCYLFFSNVWLSQILDAYFLLSGDVLLSLKMRFWPALLTHSFLSIHVFAHVCTTATTFCHRSSVFAADFSWRFLFPKRFFFQEASRFLLLTGRWLLH